MSVPNAVTSLDLGSTTYYPGISTPSSNYVSTRLSLSFVLRSPTICFSVTRFSGDGICAVAGSLEISSLIPSSSTTPLVGSVILAKPTILSSVISFSSG
jgi:hypothetical protein